ncbi:MAG: polysaccharide pyruvyl transferase family protein, partial [Anaerolineales bacterium]
MSTRQILIAGYYGRRNAGDEAILQGMLASLHVHCSDASFVVISADPVETSRSHGVRSVDWGDTETMLSEIERSSLVIVGGGGLFHDTWGFDETTFLSDRRGGISEFGSPLVWAYLRGKPCMLYGVGVGPLKQENSREAVRALFEIADIVVVRDVYSKNALQEIGFDPQRVNVACDPAFAAPQKMTLNFLPMPDEIPRPLLGVSVRPWAFSGEQAKWESAIAEALNRYLESHVGSIIFVPMQDGDLDVENDTLICARIRKAVQYPERVFTFDRPLEPLDRMALLHQCDLVLGMRLHSLVAAIRANVPCVALSYDSKVRALMERVEMSDYILSLDDIDATLVCETLDAAIDHGEKIRKSLNRFSKKLAVDAASIAEHAQVLLKRGSLRQDSRLMLVSKIIEDRQSRLNRTVLELMEVQESLRTTQSHIVALEEESEEKDRSNRSKLDEVEREKSQIQEALQQVEAERHQLELDRSELRDHLRDAEGDLNTLQKRMRELEHEHDTAVVKERQLRDSYRQERSEWDKIKASMGWRILHVVWRVVWRMRARSQRLFNVFTAFFRYFRVSIAAMAKGILRFLPIWLRGHFLTARMHQHEYIDRSQVVLYTDDESLFPGYQPRHPLRQGKSHQVVIVDGGSVDGTAEFLQRYANTSPFDFQLFVEDGANIARGRNIGIERAKHDVIVVADFGSTLSDDFLSNIVRPFEVHPETQVVAGWFEPVTSTRFGNWFKHELVPRLRDVEPQTFLPSARSMAFRRDAWRFVGGYPEWLTLTGDDTYFAMELKRKCRRWAFVPQAVVYWHAPETPGGFWRKLVSWSEGDGESSLFGDRYMQNMVIMSLITLISILVCAGILAAFFLTTALPVVLVTAFVLILSGYFSIALLSRSGGKSSFLFGFVGQWARSFGFLRGCRRRPRVTLGRYADIEGVVFILAGIPIDDSGGGSRGAQIAREFLKRNFLVVYIYKFSKAESKDLKLNIWHPRLLHVSTFDM